MNIHKLFELVDSNFKRENVLNILELGSRDGLDSIKMSQHYFNAKVVAFECNPETFSILQNNIQTHKNILGYQLAVTDSEGIIDFYQSTHGNPGSSSIFEKTGKYDYIENYKQRKIQVKSIRLDNFLIDNSIPNIDLVWADLQGSELKAFHGMGEYINSVKAILTEIEYKEMYKNQPLYPDIKIYLESKGFKEFHRTSLHDNWWGDAIFINTSLIGT